MKKTLLTLAGISLLAVSANAATNASDNSSNYSSWTNGSNQGTGFGAWALSSGGVGGFYLGATGMGSSSFGIYSGASTAGNFATADRPFTGGALASGQTFSVALGNTGIASGGGEIGFQFLDGTTVKWTLKFVGGGSSWQLNDGGSDFGIAQGFFTGSSNTLTFTYNGGNSYSYSFGSASGANFTASSGISNLTGVRFYSTRQGSGENFGFNNLSIIPEPTTAALLAVGLGAFALYRRRKAA